MKVAACHSAANGNLNPIHCAATCDATAEVVVAEEEGAVAAVAEEAAGNANRGDDDGGGRCFHHSYGLSAMPSPFRT